VCSRYLEGPDLSRYRLRFDDVSEIVKESFLVLLLFIYIGCSFKFLLKVSVEESIVNEPLVSLHSKNANNAKSEVRFKQVIRDPVIRGAFAIDS
jgi:hypothetical protein